jgi:hypothetical protein
VDPPAFGHANFRLHGVHEGGRVVICYQFSLFHVGHEGAINDGATLAKDGDFFGGQHAGRAERFRAEQFYFEHHVETVRVAK